MTPIIDKIMKSLGTENYTSMNVSTDNHNKLIELAGIVSRDNVEIEKVNTFLGMNVLVDQYLPNDIIMMSSATQIAILNLTTGSICVMDKGKSSYADFSLPKLDLGYPPEVS